MPFISPRSATASPPWTNRKSAWPRPGVWPERAAWKSKPCVTDLANYSIAAGAWAGIVATFAHLPPALRRRVHRDVVAGLQSGGVFILEAYTPAQLAFGTGGPKDPERLMTLAVLREELSGLEFLVARELERDVTEGGGHTGRAAVVQIFARRL